MRTNESGVWKRWRRRRPGEIWFALWVWHFLVICLNGFPSLWVGDAVAGSEGLLASPLVRGWALNMSRLWRNGHCGKGPTLRCVSETRASQDLRPCWGQGRDPFIVAFPRAGIRRKGVLSRGGGWGESLEAQSLRSMCPWIAPIPQDDVRTQELRVWPKVSKEDKKKEQLTLV